VSTLTPDATTARTFVRRDVGTYRQQSEEAGSPQELDCERCEMGEQWVQNLSHRALVSGVDWIDDSQGKRNSFTPLDWQRKCAD
jgi:hypothetical protein